MINSKSIILFKIYFEKLMERGMGIEHWLRLSSNTNIELDLISECAHAHIRVSETFYSTKGQRPKARLAFSTL